MKRKSTLLLASHWFVAAVLLVAFGRTSLAQAGGETLVFTHTNVIDGVSDKVMPDATVIVSNGKILTVTTGKVDLPPAAQIIDLRGKYLMPGLIDAHVHIGDFDSAKRALLSGVTTARSMGVSHFADVGMRELAAAGRIESPEIIAAGYHVRPRPANELFVDHPEMSEWLGKDMKGEDAMRQMAEIMAAHRVDWIKVNATARAGLPQTDPREPYYDEAEMKALVTAGARHGLPVAAHAHGDEGGRAAVLGGVRSIEHGTYLGEETLKLMAEKGTFLVPTIAVVSDLTMPGGDYDQPLLMIRGRHMLPRVRSTVARALELGVKIVAATDTGYDAGSTLRLGQELEELAGAGMSNAETIRAATSRAAELLGVDDHTGRIAAGLDADILIVERSPLEDVGAVHDPLLIVNNGKIVVNRLSW